MKIFYCDECQKEFDNYVSFRKHMSIIHKINSEYVYIKYILDGIRPTCKCGCGNSTKFLGDKLGFRDYIRGHIARIKNNWGHNPTAINKSHQKQKEMYQSGELIIWNKGLTKETDERVKQYAELISNNTERNEKISKVLLSKNIKKTEEQKQRNREWQLNSWNTNIEKKEKQSLKRIKWLKSKQSSKKTKLEYSFDKILEELYIKFEPQYEFKFRLFDYYLSDYNLLIETDGDFYHCNPKFFEEPKYTVQKITLKNDEYKNILCTNNNIKLLRYWEDDIKNNTEWVINNLKENLGL
jgi:very-short-patch-repair endonuclease